MSEKTVKAPAGITRRRALGLAGLAGASYVASPLRPFGGSGVDAADPVAAEAASCVLAPKVTEGPYWVDERLNRSDIRGGQEGVPLVLSLYVYDLDGGCDPYQGAIVDIWHCNASGLYSDEAGQPGGKTSGQTWLRGYQESDASGKVTFTTIYPGWYMGRAVHIHVRVRTFSGTSTTYNFTTQIFFDETTMATVYATSPYSSHGTSPDTTNSADDIYQQEARAGNVLVPSLTGNTSGGYSGSVAIALSGLPASNSSSNASSESEDKKVEARLLGRRFLTTGDRRQLVLRLRAEERIAADAQLLRGGKVIARKRIGRIAAGKRSMAIPIRGGTRAGAAALKLKLTDRAGNERVIRHRVHIPGA